MLPLGWKCNFIIKVIEFQENKLAIPVEDSSLKKCFPSIFDLLKRALV